VPYAGAHGPCFVNLRVAACCLPMQPEMTGDVQKYGKMAYLRVTEAQRCKVHSVFVVPVFDTRSPGRPLAVFELVQVSAAGVPGVLIG